MSKSITQDLKYRQSMVKYAIKCNNNAQAARKYKQTREYVRFWRKRYDGTLDSLREKSRAPHRPRLKQDDAQLDILKKVYKHHKKKQVIEMWHVATQKNYQHSYYTFLRTLKNLFGDEYSKNKIKYKPKHYETPKIPGEKVQVDVKIVPRDCYHHPDQRWVQYTFIDEATRIRFLYAAKEQSTYESTKALDAAITYFKARLIQIKLIQTDNGPEFTNRFLSDNPQPSLFEQRLSHYNIQHYKIKPYTPRHNGKVERSHRNDNERFYQRQSFSSFNDFAGKLKRHYLYYNTLPIISLKFRTPNQMLNILMDSTSEILAV